MSIFHRHKFSLVAVEHGLLLPLGAGGTTALYRCSCGKCKTESFNGRWTIEQLRGEPGGRTSRVAPTVIAQPSSVAIKNSTEA